MVCGGEDCSQLIEAKDGKGGFSSVVREQVLVIIDIDPCTETLVGKGPLHSVALWDHVVK